MQANGEVKTRRTLLYLTHYFVASMCLFLGLGQGSAGSWCSRAKFQVFKIFAGRSFSFSDI